MQAINDYVIVDIIKEEPKKISGLILTDKTVTKGDTIYYDKHAGHEIGYNDELYRVIRARDIVLVE